jgi:dipeptidyl aminopeptidase/acylaminoacyl peptidase
LKIHKLFNSICVGKIVIFAIILLCVLSLTAQSQERRQIDDIDRHERLAAQKAKTDSIFTTLSAGVMNMRKTEYKSKVGDLDIPVYIFQPLDLRGEKGHAAIVWVHENVHGDLYAHYFPFIREAVERGYVVVAPEYRGSTGYGKEFYDAIDYGGYEVDDCVTALDYIKYNLSYVDPERVGIIGWSHGGMITFLAVTREENNFKAAAAIVPVTNVVFRLGYKGPRYQRGFVEQPRIGGLPHEKRSIYIDRSPLYHVDKLKIPMLVHLADNDNDVNFVEAEQLIWALKAKKPDLAETKIYHNPRDGHGFNRIVDDKTHERMDTKAQRDSWNRIWNLFEWNLRPYQGK